MMRFDKDALLRRLTKGGGISGRGGGDESINAKGVLMRQSKEGWCDIVCEFHCGGMKASSDTLERWVLGGWGLMYD